MMILVLIAIVASLPIPQLPGRRRFRHTWGKSLGMCETLPGKYFRICAHEKGQKVSFFVLAEKEFNVQVNEDGQLKVADPVTPTSVMGEYNEKSKVQFKFNEYVRDHYKHGYRVSTVNNGQAVQISISPKHYDPLAYHENLIVTFTPKAKRTREDPRVFRLEDPQPQEN